MIYGVQALAIFTTVQRRDAAQAALEAEHGRPVWEAESVEALDGTFGSTLPALAVQVRYTSRNDAEEVWTNLEKAFDKGNPQPGSTLTLHTCTHDEITNECVVVNTRTW